ncbi:MAG: FAD-binding oxidoreductase [Dehalococcoidales bacterium]|jgi:FAD/FMN-containing dehydrogenase
MIAKKELSGIVGAGNVGSDAATLAQYAGDMSFVHHVQPDYVVKPRNADDVEKLVNLAREKKVPLVPVSSGVPHFRGDTVPSAGGAVIVDLSNMKKIIRVDRYNRVALFEPGVTYGELIPAVAKEGLRLNMPLLPRSTKSVVGSMLEREPVVMPDYHWDIADPLCDVEIILGSGALFRTGASAGPGTLEEQWKVGGAQKEAAGPSSASWYRVIQGAQGTMGIVTWASARCEILPKKEEPFLAGSSDLAKIMEMVHWLIRLRLVNECFILNSTDLATLLPKKSSHEYPQVKSSLPPWILFYNVAAYDYLTEDRIKWQVADIKDLSQRLGLEPVQSLGAASAFDLLKLVQAPSPEPYWKTPGGWGCQDIFFITAFDKVSGLVAAMHDLAAEAGYPTPDMGVYIQPAVQGVNFHVEFNLFYPLGNPAEAAKVQQLTVSAVRRLMDKGAFFSRPYGDATGAIMNRDAATVAALKKVKAILDPDNIMNPGKLCF